VQDRHLVLVRWDGCSRPPVLEGGLRSFAVARSRHTLQVVAQRTRIVLLTAKGVSPNAIGEELGLSQPTI
jgi:DNA-binding NarL/FixJ family response regulator